MTVGSTATLEALNASSLVASYPEYLDVRDNSQSFDGLAAFSYVTAGFTTDPKSQPKLKMGMLVSDNLFPLMEIEPTLGRGFTAEEHRVPGRDQPVHVGAGVDVAFQPGERRPDRLGMRGEPGQPAPHRRRRATGRRADRPPPPPGRAGQQRRPDHRHHIHPPPQAEPG